MGRQKLPVRHEFTLNVREQFLKALGEGYTVSTAADLIGFTRTTLYNYKREDAEFSAVWDDAYKRGTEFMEDEARRRAIEGTTKPIFYQGVQCGQVQEYSDTLMLALLKARDPAKFRERADVNVSGNIALKVVSFAPQLEAPTIDVTPEGDGDE